jgi:type I restriction enzyme, S subunit
MIPLPPLREHRNIVADPDLLRTQIHALKHFHVETAAELDALLPSILDRAFNADL